MKEQKTTFTEQIAEEGGYITQAAEVGRRAALPYPTSKTPRGEIRDVARCHGRGAR